VHLAQQKGSQRLTASLYPLFLNLQGRTCVVIGGNETAEAKAQELLNAGAKVRLMASSVTDRIADWSRQGQIQWENRLYKSGDLIDAFLVVSVADSETNARVFEEAEARQIVCNSLDDPHHCNCYASAVVRRGPLQIAISTSGKSPALAQRLRKDLAEHFGEDYALWVEYLGQLRERLFQQEGVDFESRRRVLHEQASAVAFEEFRNSLKAASDSNSSGHD
jgi:precorrin-2 dehydrogenase / sirohydrochlorin ferrochelatase